MSKMKLVILAFISLFLCISSLFLGPRLINPFDLNTIDAQVLLSIRLPRVIVAALMGIALGASGAILQGILRNPLADPYILGISSGAALTAAIGILSGFPILNELGIPFSALAGAFVVSIIVGAFGWKRRGIWPERLLLAGVGLGFLFHAMLMLLVSLSSHEAMRQALLWIFGDLSLADWTLVPYGVLFISGGISLALFRARALNALMLGDDIAHSLGFSAEKERLFFFIAVATMTAASVSLGGTVGFIGLIVPHIVRFFIGADNRYLIPVSALCGGAFLCMSDLIGRTVMAPTEIPSGIITALLGAPYFLYLLRRRDVLRT